MLKPGEEVKLDVNAEARAGLRQGGDARRAAAAPRRGVRQPAAAGRDDRGRGKSKTLLGTGSKGHIVLKAAPNAAPIEDVPISVLANVSVNFVVKVSYSSPVIPVTVRK